MKKKIALIFGGKSAEHEVSLRSAKNISDALDKNLFEPVHVGISKQGSWYLFDSPQIFKDRVALNDTDVPTYSKSVAPMSWQGSPCLFVLQTAEKISIDVAFPILHGTMGEDGSIQGLFKMINLPFVGCGVFASSAGMDKEIMKRILNEKQIPNAKYRLITSWNQPSYEELAQELGSTFFIKPANAGSSVGVHKIKSKEDYLLKIKDALKYDHKVLAEEFIKGREIECSVMGLNHSPKASLPGEVTTTHEFYSYEAKYLDENGSEIIIPAHLPSPKIAEIQKLACETYMAMGCDGLTRVDFFLKEDGKLLINEINTIPGFTKISMYPKMWEASGLAYTALITELINLAFEKFKLESQLSTDFSL